MKVHHQQHLLISILSIHPLLQPTVSISTYGILEKFYYKTSGDSWRNNKNWLENTNPCSWYGITCSSSSSGFDGGDNPVEKIELVDNDLIGTLPPEIFSLEGLQSLILSENEGLAVNDDAFASIGNATQLEHLRLSKTKVKSLKGISAIKDTLTSLYVEDNQIGYNTDGRLDQEVYQLYKLKQLILTGNLISGTLSKDIGLMTELEELNLQGNGIVGTLPSEIANLTKLSYLNVGNNAFEGTIPPEIGTLDRLEGLFLNNQAVGFSGPLPDFAGLKKLTEMNLRRNKLTGTIPPTFLSNSQSLSQKVYISLSYNRLIGTIPSELSRFSSLNLYLVFNYFTSLSPTLCEQDQWMDGLVGKVGCPALLCPPDTYLPSGRQLEEDSECMECDGNAPMGRWGATECRPKGRFRKDVLKGVYKDTTQNGGAWRVSTHWNSDTVGVCQWYGIECDSQSEIVGIDLSENELVGHFPSATVFEAFPNLKTLSLKSNPGLTFDTEGIWMSQIETLNLNHLGLTSLRGISEARSLMALHLTNNRFKESVLEEISQLDNLRHLLIENSNVTGRLDAIGNLKHLLTLDASFNHLTGGIPSSLASLNELGVLDLSYNKLTGSIPYNLGSSSSSLNLINLSHQEYRNGLTGPLPSFSSLSSLTTLDLSYNSLTGSIPADFLSGLSSSTNRYTINLSSNHLTGQLPMPLTSLHRLDIDLTGNKLSPLSADLCTSPSPLRKWMDSRVALYGCDAILCPPGTFNAAGRRVSDNEPCEQCDIGTTTLWAGERECVDAAPTGEERDVLMAFYESVNGWNWTRREGWEDEQSDVCDWYGVGCENGYVTSIALSNNNLFGTPSSELFKLAFLHTLDLSLNSLVYIDFSTISLARSLTELNLHNVGLNSLVGIGSASSLQILKVGRNDFELSELPKEVYQLENLRELYFQESRVGGSIAREIGDLRHLVGLYGYGNILTGQIPTTIGKLTNLTYIALAQNALTGILPPQLEQLKHLKALSLMDQTTKGGGLQGSLLSFLTNLDLTEIFLSNNLLTGSIPSTLLESSSSSSSQTSTYTIDLSSNLFTGTLPGDFSRFSRLSIDVTNNRLQGVSPALCTLGDWMDDAVGEFGCDAILCPPGTSHPEGRQELETEGCVPCSLDDAGGAVTEEEIWGATFCPNNAVTENTEREILTMLYQATNGATWKNNTGWLDEDEGVCWWHGIQCDATGRVQKILLGANNLQGAPPSSLFSLPALTMLSLYSNPIDFSFEGIEMAQVLVELALDGIGLETWDGVGKAPPSLKDLNLRFNKLQGSIPQELFELTQLEVLSLSNNQLTGTLPEEFAQMSNLETLLLSSNKFKGPLYDFEDNRFLTYLDVADNLLTGDIPSTLLSSVATGNSNKPNATTSQEVFIDLSGNSLTGTLPLELSRFTNLAIHVKNNQLTGLPPALCQLENWNYKDVGSYGCDGIVCPIGTYNEIGRRGNEDTPCKQCLSARYLGSVVCGYKSGVSVGRGVGAGLGMVLVGVFVGFIGW